MGDRRTQEAFSWGRVSRRRRLTLLGAVSMLLVVLSGSATAEARAVHRITSPMVQVGVPAVVPTGAVDLGPVSGRSRLTLEIALKLRDPRALDRFLAEVANPASRRYRHYLKRGQFGPRFGPTSSDIARVVRHLRAAGFDVGRVSASRLLIPLSTTVAAAETAFGVKLRRYRLASHALMTVSLTAPRVPRSIAPLIQGVVGLNGSAQPSTLAVDATPRDLRSRALASARAGVRTDLATGQPQPCGSVIGKIGLDAPGLAQSYDADPLYEAGDFGAGESVAMLEVSGYSASDVSAYESCYGLRPSIVTKLPDGSLPAPAAGQPPVSTVEADADIEDVTGLAPRLAHVYVYEVPRTPPGILAAWGAMQADDDAKVVSTSAGFCEPIAIEFGLAAPENTIFEAMAAQGQTVLAATGDSGAEGCDNGTSSGSELAVDDPASQPYVTGVGGTTLKNDGDPPAFAPQQTGWAGGGGGVSTLYPIPTWQSTSVPGVIGHYSSGTPCGLGSGHYCREVPDVSGDAGQCLSLYISGGWGCIKGTSVAAPALAAMIALIDDSSAQCRTKPVGFINPALYRLAVSTPADFEDVTTGSNAVGTAHGGAYPATTGYDMVTGLGYPQAANLAQSLCGGTLWTPPEDSSTVELTESPSLAAAGDTLYTAGVNNGPSDAPGPINYATTTTGDLWDFPSNTIVAPDGRPASTAIPAAIATASGDPVVAWTDFTTNKVETSSLVGGKWSAASVVGAGAALSTAGPALAGYGQSLYAAWKGESTSNVYLSINNGTGWGTQQVVPAAVTNLRPAITYDPDLAAVIVAWTTPANRIQYKVYSLLFGSFTEGATIPFASSPSGPALAVVGNQLFEAHKGTTTDFVYYSSQPPGQLVGTWTSDHTVPSTDTEFSPALAANGPTLITGWKQTCPGCSSPLFTTSSDPQP